MDAQRFEALLRTFATSPSRRGALRVLVGSVLAGSLGWLEGEQAQAAKKKKGKGGGGNKRKGKKKDRDRNPDQPPPAPPPPPEPCGTATCTGGSFCCDDERAICCAPGSSCCNVGPGTGSCCPAPGRCAKPIDDDAAPFECCPPERQWFTNTGLVRCCKPGYRSLGTAITTDDGPCCPEEKYCSNQLTGGTCCGDLAPVCVNRTTERCCTEEDQCGDKCCVSPFSHCCNGECWHDDFGPWTACGDTCCSGTQECCTNGSQSICCTPGQVCPAPCGDLPIACCSPDWETTGHCCNNDCAPNCGG